MKLYLTGLLCIALSNWLFAQESTANINNNPPTNNYYKVEGDSVISPPSSTPYKADFQMLLEIGYGPGGSNDANELLLGEVVSGFLLSPKFYAGIGTGVRLMYLPMDFWTSSLGFAVVPIYVDARFFLSKGNASPYISIDAGYSWDVNFGVEGLGFMVRPMAGLSLLRNTKNPLHMGIGYNSQMIKNRDSMGTVLFCVGISF